MFKSVFSKVVAAGAVIALAASAGVAQARDVNWSVGIGVPGVVIGVDNNYGYSGYRAPPVYYAPPPVYYPPPRPVYYAPPRPIYYSAPPAYYAPPPYYGNRRGHHHRRDNDRRYLHGHNDRYNGDWRR